MSSPDDIYAVNNPSSMGCSDRKCNILYIHVLIIIAIGVVFYPNAAMQPENTDLYMNHLS